MKKWVTHSIIALSTAASVAMMATPSMAYTLQTPTWTQGAVIDFGVQHAYPGETFPHTLTLDIFNSSSSITYVNATLQSTSSSAGRPFADYEVTVPNLGTSKAQFSVSANPPSELFVNSKVDSPFVQFLTINYVPATAGLLPEFPYAGAVPLVGVLGLGAILYMRRRSSVTR